MVLKRGDPNLTWHFIIEWVKNYVGFSSLLVWSIKVSINTKEERPSSHLPPPITVSTKVEGMICVCIDTQTPGPPTPLYTTTLTEMWGCVSSSWPQLAHAAEQWSHPQKQVCNRRAEMTRHSPDPRSTPVLWLIRVVCLVLLFIWGHICIIIEAVRDQMIPQT